MCSPEHAGWEDGDGPDGPHVPLPLPLLLPHLQHGLLAQLSLDLPVIRGGNGWWELSWIAIQFNHFGLLIWPATPPTSFSNRSGFMWRQIWWKIKTSPQAKRHKPSLLFTSLTIYTSFTVFTSLTTFRSDVHRGMICHKYHKLRLFRMTPCFGLRWPRILWLMCTSFQFCCKQTCVKDWTNVMYGYALYNCITMYILHNMTIDHQPALTHSWRLRLSLCCAWA